MNNMNVDCTFGKSSDCEYYQLKDNQWFAQEELQDFGEHPILFVVADSTLFDTLQATLPVPMLEAYREEDTCVACASLARGHTVIVDVTGAHPDGRLRQFIKRAQQAHANGDDKMRAYLQRLVIIGTDKQQMENGTMPYMQYTPDDAGLKSLGERLRVYLSPDKAKPDDKPAFKLKSIGSTTEALESSRSSRRVSAPDGRRERHEDSVNLKITRGGRVPREVRKELHKRNQFILLNRFDDLFSEAYIETHALENEFNDPNSRFCKVEVALLDNQWVDAYQLLQQGIENNAYPQRIRDYFRVCRQVCVRSLEPQDVATIFFNLEALRVRLERDLPDHMVNIFDTIVDFSESLIDWPHKAQVLGQVPMLFFNELTPEDLTKMGNSIQTTSNPDYRVGIAICNAYNNRPEILQAKLDLRAKNNIIIIDIQTDQLKRCLLDLAEASILLEHKFTLAYWRTSTMSYSVNQPAPPVDNAPPVERHEIVSEIRRALQEPTGQNFVVMGPSGMGKTRMIDWLVQQSKLNNNTLLDHMLFIRMDLGGVEAQTNNLAEEFRQMAITYIEDHFNHHPQSDDTLPEFVVEFNKLRNYNTPNALQTLLTRLREFARMVNGATAIDAERLVILIDHYDTHGTQSQQIFTQELYEAVKHDQNILLGVFSADPNIYRELDDVNLRRIIMLPFTDEEYKQYMAQVYDRWLLFDAASQKRLQRLAGNIPQVIDELLQKILTSRDNNGRVQANTLHELQRTAVKYNTLQTLTFDFLETYFTDEAMMLREIARQVSGYGEELDDADLWSTFSDHGWTRAQYNLCLARLQRFGLLGHSRGYYIKSMLLQELLRVASTV